MKSQILGRVYENSHFTLPIYPKSTQKRHFRVDFQSGSEKSGRIYHQWMVENKLNGVTDFVAPFFDER